MPEARSLPFRRSSHCSMGSCVEVALGSVDGIVVRDAKNISGPALKFTVAEWQAFIAGVKGGEFDV